MTLKQCLLESLNEDGPQTHAELVARIAGRPSLPHPSPRHGLERLARAGLWELRRDGKVERDDTGVYTALVQPDAPRQALGTRRREALTRFMAVLVVNKDRIPPEVTRALLTAWEEYMAAFGEELTETLESLVSKLETLREKESDVQAGQ